MKLILAKIFCAFDVRLAEELNVGNWTDVKIHFVAETKPLFVALDSKT